MNTWSAMMISREEAREALKTLHPSNQQGIVNNFMRTRQEYLVSNTCVLFPQFFYACNMPVFEGIEKEDLDEFININDANIFVDNAVYHMVQFIKKERAEK